MRERTRAILAERDISHVLVNSHDFLYFVPIDADGKILYWWQRFEASKSGYDVMVVGTHGRTGLTRLLMGSVAEQVIRHAACPVMTFKEPREKK